MQRRHLLALSTLSTLSTLSALGSGCVTAFAATSVRTRVETALGSFVVAVDPVAAPVTSANYLAYVDARHLDHGSVYRIVTLANQPGETKHKIQVVQWGMNLPDDKPAPLPPIRHKSWPGLCRLRTGCRRHAGRAGLACPGKGAAVPARADSRSVGAASVMRTGSFTRDVAAWRVAR